MSLDNWKSLLAIDPVKVLLTAKDPILTALVRRDLLDENIQLVPDNNEIKQIIKRQQPDGSWKFKSKSVALYPSINHDLVETFKSFRILVGKYEMDRSDSAVAKCAAYVFSCQTAEGDIRGILGRQYMPYYCGLLLELLIRAGYANDDRVETAMNWLAGQRQKDGGWVVPLQTVKVNKLDNATYAADPVRADENLSSSHQATGMALRAFAVHPVYKNSGVAKKAGELLKSRILKPDKYNDRKTPEYWIKFQYPYWWNTLLSSLDTLYSIGFTLKDKDIEKGIEWFLTHQDNSGLWPTKFDKGEKEKVALNKMWIAYDICRILKLYFS